MQDSAKTDEISQFQEARYVGSTEASNRILGLHMHERFPPVMQLAVHLENGQRVYFYETTVLHQAHNEPPRTTLTQFFILCQHDDFAKTLTYPDLPHLYTWDGRGKKWRRRKRGAKHLDHPNIFKAQCIGRVYTISPNQQECYYLRMLLHHVKGPSCFDDLKKVNGTTCITYRQACLQLGLIPDDNHLNHALTEANMSQSPHLIRKLFAIM